MRPVKISVVIPVYNSEECLPELNSKLEEALAVFDHEIILVNDGSQDSSWKKITQICAANRFAKGINFRKNFGQDNAVIAGMNLASGDYVAVMDDDLQHAPSDIIKLYSKCAEGYDICYGNFASKKQKGWKNLGSWINGKLSEKMLQKPPHIYLSPFKVITRGVVEEVIKYSGPFPYIDATLLTITSNVTQISLEHHPRLKGKSNFNLARSFMVFVKHATNYSIYPLRIISVLGFVIALFSFALGLVYLIEYFFDSKRIEGWITLVILVIFFGGMILMSLGLIGEYVGRIFLSLNKKPQFTIDKIIGQEHEQLTQKA